MTEKGSGSSMPTPYTRSDGTPRPWIIYLLSDPRTSEVRYIGKAMESRQRRETPAKVAARRLGNHLSEARSRKHTHKLHWLRSLLAEGVKPEVVVAEVGEGPGCSEAETRWIATGHVLGVRLVNATEGGEGTPGHIKTEEARFRSGAANRGKHLTPETRAKLSAAGRGKKHTPEHVAKVAEANRGRRPSPEAMAKRVASLRGKPLSAEHKAKLSASGKGKTRSDATRAVMGDAQRRAWADPTERAKRAAAIQAGIKAREERRVPKKVQP